MCSSVLQRASVRSSSSHTLITAHAVHHVCLLQVCVAVCCCNTLQHNHTHSCSSCLCLGTLQHTATHCNTLQYTATHCNTLQHTAIHCNVLQHTATHCNTLQHTATHCNTLQQTYTHTCSVCSCRGTLIAVKRFTKFSKVGPLLNVPYEMNMKLVF